MKYSKAKYDFITDRLILKIYFDTLRKKKYETLQNQSIDVYHKHS